MKNIYIKIIGYLCAAFMALPLFGMDLVPSKKPVITGTFSLNKRLGFAYATENYHLNILLGKEKPDVRIPIAFIKIILDEKPDVAGYDEFYDDNHQTLKEQNIEKCLLSDLIHNEQLIQNGSTIVREYPQFTLKLKLQDASFEDKCSAMFKAFEEKVVIIGNEDDEQKNKEELIQEGVVAEDIDGNLKHSECGYVHYLSELGLLDGKREEWVATDYQIDEFSDEPSIFITFEHESKTQKVSYLIEGFNVISDWKDPDYPNIKFVMSQDIQERLTQAIKQLYPLEDGNDDSDSFIIVNQDDNNSSVSENRDNDLTLSSESESNSEENEQKAGSFALKYLLPVGVVATSLMYLMYAKSPQFREGMHYYLGLIMRMVR